MADINFLSLILQNKWGHDLITPTAAGYQQLKSDAAPRLIWG